MFIFDVKSKSVLSYLSNKIENIVICESTHMSTNFRFHNLAILSSRPKVSCVAASYVYAVDRARKDASSHAIRFRFGFKSEFVWRMRKSFSPLRASRLSVLAANEPLIISTLRITSICNISFQRSVNIIHVLNTLILQSGEFIKNFIAIINFNPLDRYISINITHKCFNMFPDSGIIK